MILNLKNIHTDHPFKATQIITSMGAGIEVCCNMIPKGLMGGDFFYHNHFIFNPQPHLALFDVMGHGLQTYIEAQFFDPQLQMIFQLSKTPSEFFIKAEKLLNELSTQGHLRDGLFLEGTCIFFEPSSKRLVFCAPTAHPPFFYRSQKKQLLSYNQTDRGVVGVDLNIDYHETTLQYEKNDLLFLYTDGLYDNLNMDNATVANFLEREFSTSRKKSSAQISISILENLKKKFPKHIQTDDLSFVVVKF